VQAVDAEPVAHTIEAESYAVAETGGVADFPEEWIEAIQFYSKEVSRRLLHFVLCRYAAAVEQLECSGVGCGRRASEL
jgi:hypothetical protein